MANRFKLKVGKFLGLIPTILEVTGEKLVRWGGGGGYCPPILNRVKALCHTDETLIYIYIYIYIYIFIAYINKVSR